MKLNRRPGVHQSSLEELHLCDEIALQSQYFLVLKDSPQMVPPSVRATLPPSTLFADRALLRRGYSISEPNALVETVSKYKGLH